MYLSKEYKDCKNYIYSKYSGINSLCILDKSDKLIRDVWTHNGFIDNWGIPRRFIRNAIDDAIGNIKTNWIASIKKIKRAIVESERFTEQQKHLAFYILKAKPLLQEVLTTHNINKVPDKFAKTPYKDRLFVYKQICRLYRKHKGNVPHTKSLTMQFDGEMYCYNKGNISLTCSKKGKRIVLQVNTDTVFKGNIKINVAKDKITISKGIVIYAKKNENPENVIGIDKNYVNAIDTSNETSFGVNLNKIQTNYSDRLQAKNKKRQFYFNKVKELLKPDKDGNVSKENRSKAQRIIKFNLGKVKYNKEKNRLVEEMRKCVNKGINDLLKMEKPTEIVCEDLSFQGKNKKKRSKRNKRLLGGWIKGYIQEKVEYKSAINGTSIYKTNAAYTSQTCSLCEDFGVRKGDMFHCSNCNRVVYSGHESAKVTLARRYDKEITLKTPPKKVKAILEKRLLDKEKNKGLSEPSQPRPSQGGANDE